MTTKAQKEAQREVVPLAEAKEQVRRVSMRLGLLHLAFARTIVNELGENKGKQLILKAIKDYGVRIGKESKAQLRAQGKESTPQNMPSDLPLYGMLERMPEAAEVGGEKRFRAYGCVMGQVWLDAGEGELGRLYCFVDPAKSMAYNPSYKMVHLKALPEGHPYCELAIRPTTEQERKDFAAGEDWEYIDRPKQ